MTDDAIMECYKDLALAITVEDCKVYYSRLLKKDTYASTNRKWYLREITRLRDYLLNDSWAAHFGVNMENVLNDLDRLATKRVPLNWSRVVNTANNKYTKGV